MAQMTIIEIAKKCGVGVSTVSRALNDHSDINPETKQRILKVIEETGYVPNNSARNLKRTDAKCIAVLIKGITNPVFSPMIEIIEEETKKHGYALVLRHVEAKENEVDVALELEKEKRLRGIVFLGGGFRHEVAKLKTLKVPVIFSTIGNPLPDKMSRSTYSTLAVDDEKESARMTEHLIRLGHKEIVMITEGCEEPSVGSLRLQGYKKALTENGLDVEPCRIRYVDENLAHFSMQNGYETTKKLLEDKIRFTAIFCASDQLAMGAVRALCDAGLKVPEDVSVAGFDGIDMAEYFIPRLTTMKQPLAEIAAETIHLLFGIIDEGQEHCHITFDAALVEGESTAVREG